MAQNQNFTRIWIAVAVVSFALHFCLELLMRPSFANNQLMPWHLQPNASGLAILIAATIVLAVAFAYIFLQGYRGGGAAEGVRFGIWATLLASVPANLAFGAVLPEGRRIPAEFILLDLVTYIACGVVAATLAGKGAPEAQQKKAAA
jgi:hypothetical protein